MRYGILIYANYYKNTHQGQNAYNLEMSEPVGFLSKINKSGTNYSVTRSPMFCKLFNTRGEALNAINICIAVENNKMQNITKENVTQHTFVMIMEDDIFMFSIKKEKKWEK